MARPLEHIKIIDLTRARSGPTCIRQLSDMGAQIIRVEAIDYDDVMGRHGFDFQNLHRNKRSMTLNLKDPRGKALLKQLVQDADVLVENFRPPVKTRLGIDYPALRSINPRLIYASLSGFGQTGPYANRPGFDQIAQGMGGLMSVTGTEETGPLLVGIPIADLCAGVLLAQGILVALLERERSGEGQWVHTSLLEAQIAMLDFQATRWLIAKEVPPPAGNNHPTSLPAGVFQVKNDRVIIQAAGQHIYRRLCKALGAPELVDDSRFATPAERYKNRDLLKAAIEEILQDWTMEEAVERLNQAGVPAGPILQIDQTFENEQVKHLSNLVQEVNSSKLGRLKLLGIPVTLSRTPGKVVSATPEKGEHTDEILLDLGYDTDQIRELRQEGVI
jgi:crotonobetainyl-CoA:carnitine CoA-transferase CaiB-like acyl-CoA transferase